MVECKNCGKKLGIDPVDKLEHGTFKELIVKHEYSGKESTKQFDVAKKYFFCSVKCFKEYIGV